MVLRIVYEEQKSEEERTHTLFHVFDGKAFNLRVRSDTQKIAANDLSLTLVYAERLATLDNEEPPSEKMLTVHVKENVTPNEVMFKLSLHDLIDMPRDEPVQIRFTTADSTVESRPMMIVKYQFKVTSTLTSLWYKDEGGKDKTMSVAFNLVDVDGEHVNTKTNRDIKDLAVSFSLVYGVTIKRKKDRVKKKQKTTKKATPILPRVVNRHDDVYTLMPGTVLNLDSDEDGVCHFRIDEVTKNHQNQSFCLMISVDRTRCSLPFNIAFGLSNHVTVRSKRNKRKLKTDFHMDGNKKQKMMMMSAAGSLPYASNNSGLTQWACEARNQLLRMRNEIDILLNRFQDFNESNVPTLAETQSTELFLRSLDVHPPQQMLAGSSIGSDTTDNSTVSHQNGSRLLSMPRLNRDASWGSVGQISRQISSNSQLPRQTSSGSQMDLLADAAASPASAMLMRQTSFDRSVASIVVDNKQQKGTSVGLFSHQTTNGTSDQL